MTAWLFLVVSALFGVALVRRSLSRVALTLAEQALWGLVVGWSLSTAATYALARAAGGIHSGHMIAFIVALAVVSLLLWWPDVRRGVRATARLRGAWTFENLYLALLLALFAPVYLFLFRTHMLQTAADGRVYSGGSASYDMGLHAAISTSFLYGQNFPPVYTIFPPEPLLYPFLPDFQTSVLMSLGMTMHTALVSTAVPLALALTGIFYIFALRVLRAFAHDDDEKTLAAHVRAAALAALLFLMGGGLGFVYLPSDWQKTGKGFAEFWSRLDINYANMSERDIYWTNLITDTLLPQRASLFGMPLALIVFTLFAICWRGWSEDESDDRWQGWRALLAAGVVAGALPLFHTHSYVAVGLVSGFLFLLRPRRVWLAFWLPAVLIALPRFVGLAGHVAGTNFVRFQFGWRAPHDVWGFAFFWVKNLGALLLVALPAYFAAPRAWRKFYLAFVGLMLFSLLVVVSPNDYDNIKIMYYWHAVNCVLIAWWLVRVATTNARRFIALALTIILVASGLLALHYESLSRKLLFTREEVSAAAFARERTPRRALFLTAPSVHQPVSSLAGRAILRGDTAWLWSHGYPFAERESDVRAIYQGREDALELLDYYRVDYVYLGGRERELFKADEAFFERNFPAVYSGGDIRIYDAQSRARDGQPASDPLSDRDARRTFPVYPPREFAARLDRDPYQLIVEFPEASYAVYRLQRVARGRAPEFKEFMSDMHVVGRGVYVGAAGWRERLEENKRALFEEWATRAEFKNVYDALGDDRFVDALYANASVKPARAERERLIEGLRDGRETRASALRRIADTEELYRRDYNAAYLLMHYFGYLRRGPTDPPDRNLDGFNFWLAILERTNDYRNITRAFIEAGEYKDRHKSSDK